MPRATLATAQTRKQVNELVDRITNAFPAGAVTVTRGNISVAVKHNSTGEKLLSAVTARGKWSVQVTEEIAKVFALPLWKDSF